MARLTLQLGGSFVVPITAARRLPADWRLQFLMEAKIPATVPHSFGRNDWWRLADLTGSGRVARERGQAPGALQ